MLLTVYFGALSKRILAQLTKKGLWGLYFDRPRKSIRRHCTLFSTTKKIHFLGAICTFSITNYITFGSKVHYFRRLSIFFLVPKFNFQVCRNVETSRHRDVGIKGCRTIVLSKHKDVGTWSRRPPPPKKDKDGLTCIIHASALTAIVIPFRPKV